jgi:hypothetical protein
MAFPLTAGQGLAIAGGAGVFSALLGSNAASNAASTQAAAADRAAALQKAMFDRTVELNAPFRAGGLAAQNRLLEFMGLRPAGGQVGQAGAPRSEAELRQALMAQYTSPSRQVAYATQGGPEGDTMPLYRTEGGGVDEAGLSAAIARMRQGEQTAYEQTSATPSADFGKYARDFSMADYQADPGYAFRLQQGQQAIERSAAARGGLGGGRMAKDLTNYAQGAASQEYGNAYNRYQTNRANQLNPLQSLAGVAQSATNTIGQAEQNYAKYAGNNAITAGDARASGYLGAASGLNKAISTGYNAYQNYDTMNRLFPQSGYVPPIQDNGYSFGTGSAYGGQRAGL